MVNVQGLTIQRLTMNRKAPVWAGLVLPLTLALALAGCSTVDSLVGNEPEPAKGQSKAAEQSKGEGAAGKAAVAQPADTNTYPSLSNTPDKPNPSTTPQQRRAIQEGLVADREKANHTAEQLRGGGEAAAVPPPPAPAPAAKDKKPAAAAPDAEAESETPPAKK